MNAPTLIEELPPDEAADKAAELVDNMLASGKISLAVSGSDEEADSEPDPFARIEIPYQAAIVAYAIVDGGVADGGIEIHQDGQHGSPEEDGGIIHVNKFAVVATARAMLHAAGFRDVTIQCGRHSEEVLDGQVSCQFDFTPLPPFVRPAPPTPARAEPLKKPEPDIFDDADAVTLQRQLETAIYRNSYGALVLRQQDFDFQNDDGPYVVILKENVSAILEKVRAVMAED